MLAIGMMVLFGVAAGAVFTLDWGSSDDPADANQEDDAGKTPGSFLELDVADQIETVEPAEANSIVSVSLDTYVFETDAFEEHTGSEQDENFTLGAGNHLVDVRGGGADLVDAQYADTALIFFGDGDIILGSDNAAGLSDFTAIAFEGGEFQGGAGDEFAQAVGDGATLSGNGGDDLLMSDSGSSTLLGGEGDDTLVGGVTEASFEDSDSSGDLQTDDRAEDHLYGGDGDDLIKFSTGDVVEGGDGFDRFVMQADTRGENAEAIIQDFSRGEDGFFMDLHVPYQDIISAQPADGLVGDSGLSFVEENGYTEVLWAGNVLCRLENTAGLTARVTLVSETGEDIVLTWQDGAQAEVPSNTDMDLEIFIHAKI